MVTPRYKLPEMVDGSLQMSAYNHRLMGIEALMSPITNNNPFDTIAGNPNFITNTSTHLINANPTQNASNWYATKANHLHVQIDGCPAFIAPSKVDEMVIKNENSIRYKGQKIVDPHSLYSITLGGGTYYLSSLAKYNFLYAITTGAEALLLPQGIGDGEVWIINSGGYSITLRLLSGNTSNLLAGDKQKIAIINSAFVFLG